MIIQLSTYPLWFECVYIPTQHFVSFVFQAQPTALCNVDASGCPLEDPCLAPSLCFRIGCMDFSLCVLNPVSQHPHTDRMTDFALSRVNVAYVCWFLLYMSLCLLLKSSVLCCLCFWLLIVVDFGRWDYDQNTARAMSNVWLGDKCRSKVYGKFQTDSLS